MQISTVPLGRDTPCRPDPQLKLRAILKRARGASAGRTFRVTLLVWEFRCLFKEKNRAKTVAILFPNRHVTVTRVIDNR